MKGRVLVVEDEDDVRRLLTFNLQRAGFEVFEAATGADALITAAKEAPQVILLDLMLPDLGGIAICQRLRQDPDLGNVGILMLTALSSDEDRLEGLSAGADDYVVKPFNVEEIILRVRAIIRRLDEREHTDTNVETALHQVSTLSLNPRTHRVEVEGQAVQLRPLEYKLLATLIAEPGRVFTRDELIRSVWDMDSTSNPRLVDVHIRRLRKNLRGASQLIETVPGFGYRVAVPSDA